MSSPLPTLRKIVEFELTELKREPESTGERPVNHLSIISPSPSRYLLRKERDGAGEDVVFVTLIISLCYGKCSAD